MEFGIDIDKTRQSFKSQSFNGFLGYVVEYRSHNTCVCYIEWLLVIMIPEFYLFDEQIVHYIENDEFESKIY